MRLSDENTREGRHLTPEERIALQAEEIKQLWQENEQLQAQVARVKKVLMSNTYFKAMSVMGCEGGITRRNLCRHNCCDGENCVTWLEKQFVKLNEYEEAKAEGRLVVLPKTGIGNLSDGYHTFNELYHHRAILFSVICNEHPDISWKSKLHHDGTMFDGMFIVGINTPEGQATYHYDINPYWDMFRVRELEKAPEWDGHTSEQAIERIAGLTTDKDELVKVLKQAREVIKATWSDESANAAMDKASEALAEIDKAIGGKEDV